MNKKIKIVMLGDSMTETAGQDCKALRACLSTEYPGQDFDLLNYGVGGTRVGYGLWRLTNEYEFRDVKYPPLLETNPDIVLLESFAYNNGSDGDFPGGIEHFRDMHRKIVQSLREKTTAEIVFVVTVAPDMERFIITVPNFVYTPVSILRKMAEDRVKYLEEGLKIAAELELPVVNVYQATLDAESKGIPRGTFIDQNDLIHPSEEGHILTASLTLEVFKEYNIIEKVQRQCCCCDDK
jgi:lysophospholipase L1-like esterase